MASVGIYYTWANNLLKTGNMSKGAVSFKNYKLVKLIYVEKNNKIIWKLTKSKTDVNPDFAKEYSEYCDEI